MAMEIIAALSFNRSDLSLTVLEPNGQSFPLFLLEGNTFIMPLFIAIVATDSIVEEYRSGTMKKILLLPLNRMDSLHAKLASLIVIIVYLMIFQIITAYCLGDRKSVV